MTLTLRPYIALLLSLMLAFTGQGLAVARGLPGPDGTMEICTAQGPVMVSVDAEGQPVGTPHLCPDGALSLIQAAFAAPIDMARAMIVQRADFPMIADPVVGWTRTHAQARAPPRAA